MPAIDSLMASVDLKPKDLDRIVVAQGPGSYTGLRVAVATAKMLAYSLGIDLVGVSSLYALAAQTCQQYPDSLVVPLVDARRQNAYVGYYRQGKLVLPESHSSLEAILTQLEGRLISLLLEKRLLLLSAFKRNYLKPESCQPSLQPTNAVFWGKDWHQKM